MLQTDSGAVREPLRSSRTRAEVEVEVEVEGTTTPTAPVDVVDVEQAKQALADRGILNPDRLLEHATPQAILDTCQWWDRQHNVGAGLLVNTIRNGGRPRQPARSLVESQQDYADRICAWLQHHFPDLCQTAPHPAAVVAVIHLHHLRGKNTLTASEHGQVIRDHVKAWNDRHSHSEPERIAA